MVGCLDISPCYFNSESLNSKTRGTVLQEAFEEMKGNSIDFTCISAGIKYGAVTKIKSWTYKISFIFQSESCKL